MKQIICKNLEIGYDNNSIAGKINLSVETGDFIGVIGENGSGKTTFMKTLLGLIKPLGGELDISRKILETGIGYLPQQSEMQKDFPASVDEIIMSGFQKKAGLRPFYTKKEKKEKAGIMDILGISNLSKQKYSNLSGGQRQRVLLARALMATDEILLLDEPVTGLDPNATMEMYEILKKLSEEKTTIIMISHDIDETVKLSGKILRMGYEEEVFFGTKASYIEKFGICNCGVKK